MTAFKAMQEIGRLQRLQQAALGSARGSGRMIAWADWLAAVERRIAELERSLSGPARPDGRAFAA